MAVFIDSLPINAHRCDVQTRRGSRCKRRAVGWITASAYRPEIVGRYQCRQHICTRLDRMRWW